MGPSNRFNQRTENGRWAPPRPRHSNVLIQGPTNRRWYEYNNWRTVQVQQPNPETLEHYKTYSFYYDEGKIWIYPDDAIRHQVGEITGNERIGSGSRGNNTNDTSSSNESDDSDDRSTEDWLPLRFRWNVPGDNTNTSYATTRALNNNLEYQRADQASLRQILPDRYFARPENRRERFPFGGLIGELPILIALITLSVRPDYVDAALRHCLQRTYQAHNRPGGEGCKDHT